MNKPPKASLPSPLGGHTISVVADRTGLSRDVLRVWERRYQAVEPIRTPGGQRLYSDEELQRFQLLAAATRHGRTIGSVAGLSTGDLAKLVADDEAAHTPASAGAGAGAEAAREALYRETAELALGYARALDASSLDRELRRAVGRYGLPVLLESIVPMLMRRIGDEWAADRLAISHEHLASAIVLALLLEAVRSIPETPGAPRLLVATPAGEQHVVGAALIAAAAALDGWSILFLGADVPAPDLVMAAGGVRAVALSIVHGHDAAHTVRELQAVRAALPAGVPLVVGGAAVGRLQHAFDLSGITVCHGIADARSVFARILRGPPLVAMRGATGAA